MNRFFAFRVFPLVVAFMLSGAASSARSVWYVDDDAPGDPGPADPGISDPLEDGSPDHPFDAIQEGINAAVDGDLVLVRDGTYTGAGNRELDFGGRRITVRSENGSESCIIDCQSGVYHAFYFHNNETSDAVVEGLAMQNSRYLPAFLIGGAAPAVRDCIFRGNYGLTGPGAVYVGDGNASTVFWNCRFLGNSGQHYGAAQAYGSQAAVAFVNCEFSGNSSLQYGGAASSRSGGDMSFVNCTFIGNSASQNGGAIYLDGSYTNVNLANCAFVGNQAGNHGGGICANTIYNELFWVNLYNCTFAGNQAVLGRSVAEEPAAMGGGIWQSWNSIYWDGPDGFYWGSGGCSFGYCDVFGGVGGQGNIDADPLFVRAPHPGPDGVWGTDDDDYGDERLGPDSPCIDAANSDELPADVYDLDGDGDTGEPIPYDLDGRARLVDDPDVGDTGVGFPCVDMGPYEEQASSDVASAEEGPVGAGISASPNPCHLGTVIWIDTPRARPLTLSVYDICGMPVRTISMGKIAAGRRSLSWDGRDEQGRMLPAGLYLVRLEDTGGSHRAVKVILAR